MKIKFLTFTMIASVGVTLFSLRLAGSEDAGLHFVTRTSRPIFEVCFALEERYHWSLSYEEGPVLAADRLTNKVSPTGLPVLIKRVSPLSIDLNEGQVSAKSIESRLHVINNLLSTYTRNNGDIEFFRAVPDGQFIHIVPSQIRGEDGNLQAFQPVLDTKISFSEQHFENLYEVVELVLEQVRQKRGTPIVLGSVPNNLFHQPYSFVESADDEPAAQVLMRAFYGINGPRLQNWLDAINLTWDLSYNATDRQYWFSVGVVVPGASVKQEASTNSSRNATKPYDHPRHTVRIPNGN